MSGKKDNAAQHLVLKKQGVHSATYRVTGDRNAAPDEEGREYEFLPGPSGHLECKVEEQDLPYFEASEFFITGEGALNQLAVGIFQQPGEIARNHLMAMATRSPTDTEKFIQRCLEADVVPKVAQAMVNDVLMTCGAEKHRPGNKGGNKKSGKR